MTGYQAINNHLKIFQSILLISMFLVSITISGCAIRYNNFVDYQDSINNKNYAQAAIRLERCANFSRDSDKCTDILEKFKKSGLPIAEAIKKNHEEELERIAKEKEIDRIHSLRQSDNPWDKLELALEIQSGHIEASYQDEDKALIEQAFFGFGECAKQTNPSCMTQYAQMILYGIDDLSEDQKESAKEKAIYWLKLSARYGNEAGRRLLISLEEDIPTPDLSMENLQKKANAIAEADISARKEAERQQTYFNSQMLQETRKANFISSMRYFFPRTVNCTTTKIGAYTYTRCY